MAKEKKKDKGEEKVKKAEKPVVEKKVKATKPAKVEKVETPVPTEAPAKKATKATKPTLAISNDDIALRAYFIAEKRNHHGHHGDTHSDWVEAERQLREEAKKAAKKA